MSRRRKAVTQMRGKSITARPCAQCGDPVWRRKANYCSGRCRQAAYNARQRAARQQRAAKVPLATRLRQQAEARLRRSLAAQRSYVSARERLRREQAQAKAGAQTLALVQAIIGAKTPEHRAIAEAALQKFQKQSQQS